MASADHGSQSLEEPKTPMWLPALGALLFLITGIWWATRPAEVEVTADPAAAASAAPAATGNGNAAPPGNAPQGAGRPGQGAPDPHAGHGH